MSAGSVGGGMHRDAHGAGTQHAVVNLVALLKNFDHGFVGMIVRFHSIDGHVKIRIEWFSSGVNALKAVPRERVPELFVDQL
jgi:hypothetical protein